MVIPAPLDELFNGQYTEQAQQIFIVPFQPKE